MNAEPSKKPLTAEDTKAELERIRAAKQPTRKGILICGQTMAQMLQLGWRAEQLDSLEILFWSVRDANGEVLSPAPQAPKPATTT